MTKYEINRKIATEVMGWHLSGPHQEWRRELEFPTGFFDNKKLDYWNPAERIDHAWMVVEKLKEKYCEVGVFYHFEYQPDDGWYCWIGYSWKVQARADTAPMAISLAALKAKDGENGQA